MSRPFMVPLLNTDDSGTIPLYEPWLAIPTVVTKMDQRWQSCAGFVVG